MDEKILKERLAELAEAMNGVPAQPPPSAAGAYASHAPPSAKTPEELLDFVRLQAKYLVFDLEATRRENRYLRQMLERRPSIGEGDQNL